MHSSFSSKHHAKVNHTLSINSFWREPGQTDLCRTDQSNHSQIDHHIFVGQQAKDFSVKIISYAEELLAIENQNVAMSREKISLKDSFIIQFSQKEGLIILQV